jgi:two-component system sensor histidine kinase PilS (NtrC family)
MVTPAFTDTLPHPPQKQETFNRKLNWLISSRFLFAVLLLGSTAAFQIANRQDAIAQQIIWLYLLSGGIVLLSAVYGLVKPVARGHLPFFISLQICIDAVCISFIVFVTGGYASVFSFLYLVVVIYSSVFVFKRGTLLVALFCSLQFILLLILELYGHIDAFWPDGMFAGSDVTGIQVFQKSGIMTVACFSVALLSGYLSDQERKSKAELAAMEVHLDRVQNLAQIGEMAAGLAHEIKNPLASLSGAIQILKGEIEHNADNERLMHIVLRETDRLSSLVNNFLTFARPSAGQTKPVDLGAALKEIVTLFEKNESMVQVELTASEDTWIEIDPMQLRQVIWNLLLNGVESIESEGTVRIRVQKRKSGWAVVEIADNGCGMDENTVKAIFNPFYTTKPNGTGLGLSIVYRILETYGCRMDVRSTPGSGSVFTLFFQLIDPTKSNR